MDIRYSEAVVRLSSSKLPQKYHPKTTPKVSQNYPKSITPQTTPKVFHNYIKCLFCFSLFVSYQSTVVVIVVVVVVVVVVLVWFRRGEEGSWIPDTIRKGGYLGNI